jgi:hypothetical protein
VEAAEEGRNESRSERTRLLVPAQSLFVSECDNTDALESDIIKLLETTFNI